MTNLIQCPNCNSFDFQLFMSAENNQARPSKGGHTHWCLACGTYWNQNRRFIETPATQSQSDGAVADLIKRLRDADRESIQRANGSNIFGEAADCIEILQLQRGK